MKCSHLERASAPACARRLLAILALAGCAGTTCPPAPIAPSAECLAPATAESPGDELTSLVGGDTPWVLYLDVAQARTTSPGARIDGVIRAVLGAPHRSESEAILATYVGAERLVIAAHPGLRRETYLALVEGSNGNAWLRHLQSEHAGTIERGTHTLIDAEREAAALLAPNLLVFGSMAEVLSVTDRFDDLASIERSRSFDREFLVALEERPTFILMGFVDASMRQELQRDRDSRAFASDLVSVRIVGNLSDRGMEFRGEASFARPAGATAFAEVVAAAQRELIGELPLPAPVREAVSALHLEVREGVVTGSWSRDADQLEAIVAAVERELSH